MYLSEYCRSRKEIYCQMLRSMHVHETYFNFNSFSTKECLIQFQFEPEDMKRILNIFDWTGETSLRGYVCSDIIAAGILLRQISYPC